MPGQGMGIAVNGCLFLRSPVFACDAGEKFPEAHERVGDVVAGNDEGHCHDNQHDAAGNARGHALAEYQHAEKYRRQRLQCTQNGSRRGTDVLDGARRAEERHRRGECR